MAPQGSAYNVDWVASNTSNIHVATHRDWFDTYTEFPTEVRGLPWGGPTVKAHGIGTVTLETRVYDESQRHRPSRAITLNNVLYIPNYLSNIFAFTTENEYSTELHQTAWHSAPTASTVKTRDSGRLVGLIVWSPAKLARLWLKGQSKMQTSLEADSEYYIHATWPPEERARWEEYRSRGANRSASASTDGNKAATTPATISNPPLTKLEKEYLKKGWGNEFKFLQTYGFKIHDDESRAEGRQLLRGFIEEDADDSDDSVLVSDESNSFAAELERDPTSHVADYHFSKEQLEWIKKHYKHSGNFMRSFGLKPWEDEDCLEAAGIVKVFMDNDDEDDEDDDEDDEDEDDEDDDDDDEDQDNEDEDDDGESVESNQFLADMERDPTSHMSDYHFTAKELDWIEKHYQHSGNFMRCHGLKPWEDEDCKEAASIVKATIE